MWGGQDRFRFAEVQTGKSLFQNNIWGQYIGPMEQMKILECFIVFPIVEMWGRQQIVTGLLQHLLENVHFSTFFPPYVFQDKRCPISLIFIFIKSQYKFAKDGWHDICEMAASQREALRGISHNFSLLSFVMRIWSCVYLTENIFVAIGNCLQATY